MITFFNRKEVYNGFSMEQCSNIRDILSANKIKYDYRCVSNSNSPSIASRSALMGSFGENQNLAYMYYVYVHKKDYDQACYLINKIRVYK